MPNTENKQTNYPYPFEVRDNCLYMTSHTQRGNNTVKICNFVPSIVSEKTVDDGATVEKSLVLTGTHADGSILPTVEVSGSDLSTFNWLLDKWGAKCIIEVGQNRKEYLRYYIQTTAEEAEQLTEYRVTGWKKVGGEWFYLLPGDDKLDVKLRGKLEHYSKGTEWNHNIIRELQTLYLAPPAPKTVILPLLAFTFLTPLNEFLRRAGCMPKFILFLSGRTGTRKSTLAALFLSFFGRFTSSDLPMSFRDTANSILLNAFTLKDVLTCIDDYYPADSAEAKKLGATAQSVLRAYGDRSGRARLRADSTLMESRPPQGNAIITGEISPNVGESGTARYFTLELKENDVDLNMLTAYQEDAADGIFQNSMLAYTEWLKRRFLKDNDHTDRFIARLKELFFEYRKHFTDKNNTYHGRLNETAALLMLGMYFFLLFMKENSIIQQEDMEKESEKFSEMLIMLMNAHSESVRADIPTHIFVRKLYSLIDGGKVIITERSRPENFDPYPPGYIGCQDDEYYYLNKDLAHSAVKKLCADQGESFPFTPKALAKALAEEGLIKTTSTGNTVSIRYCGKNMRFIALEKSKAEAIAGSE